MRLSFGSKKANFVLFAIFFAVLVIWIGVFTFNYLKEQKEIPLPPSAVDMSNIVDLLNDLKRETGIPFSGISSVSFDAVKGRKFEAENISEQDHDKIVSFLKEQGFDSSDSGYKKENIVCLINVIQDKIEVMCGELK